MKVFTPLFYVILLAGASLRAEETGSTEGLLTSKGEYFLQITPDGQEAVKLVPVWKGGLPKDGGGFDKETLANIKDVKIGSKLRVDWKQDDFKRIVKVAVLEQPKPVEVAHNDETKERPRSAASGSMVGTVVDRRPRRLVLKTQSGELENVFLPLIGGEPDVEAIKKLGEVHNGDMVKLDWELTNGRRTVTKIIHRGE